MLTILLASISLTAIIAVGVLTNLLLKSRSRSDIERAEDEARTRAQMQKIFEAQAVQYESSAFRVLEETRRNYEQQIRLLEERLERQTIDIQRQSSLEFSSLARKVLDAQMEQMRMANSNDLGAILNPLREKLSDFQKAVNDSYVQENSQREALSQRIESLARSSSEIGIETRRLSNALRGNASLQGKWGEIVLQELLEKAGLVENVHFFAQTSDNDGETLKGDEGKRQRPDIILNLPGKHKVIIDSKTSMTAYFKYSEAENEAEAAAEIKKHALATRRHIDELASKQYHKNIAGALEHTLMFIPNDAAYLAAIRGDGKLPDYALSKNVAIVSPAHLLSIVQLISQLWRIENQNRNAENIAKLGGQLYDKIVMFVAEFESIEKHIDSAKSAYDKCLKHLTQGRGNMLSRTEKLREMGAKTTRQLPERLLFDSEPADPSNSETA